LNNKRNIYINYIYIYIYIAFYGLWKLNTLL
jgi:hypothetical protein